MLDDDLELLWVVALSALMALIPADLEVARFRVEREIVWIGIDGDGSEIGFRVTAYRDVARADALRRVVDELLNWLPTTKRFWGINLPVCPAHPGKHALQLRAAQNKVELFCPETGAAMAALA